MGTPQVLIVILTFNGWPDVYDCLNSLRAVTYPNFEILIVDNGSLNPPIDKVKTSYPHVTIVRNISNLGYAAGNNVGLRYALERKTAYVMLLNDDTLVAPDSLSLLVESAESHPRAAFVGPMVFHFDEPGTIQSAGGMLTWNWHSFHRGRNETDVGQYVEIEEVKWITGCAILARMSVIERIGLLDPDFYSYDEEVDWCLRASEAGFQVLFVPLAKIWHKGVRRNYDPGPVVTYLTARNELHLLAKHRAGPAVAFALVRDLRTIASLSLRPRWRGRREHRNALVRALRDFALGINGAPRPSL